MGETKELVILPLVSDLARKKNMHNFECSFWMVKPKFCENGHQVVSSCHIFSSKARMLLIQCALESPELGEHFKCLEHYHTTLRKNSRAT